MFLNGSQYRAHFGPDSLAVQMKFGGWRLRGGTALQSPQNLRQRSAQRGYNLAECSQARLAGSPLQVGDVDFMDTRMLGKVNLSPAFGPAQFSDALSSRRADVLCHSPMFGLVDALYLAHTLCGFER